jgi:hypothetical protein
MSLTSVDTILGTPLSHKHVAGDIIGLSSITVSLPITLTGNDVGFDYDSAYAAGFDARYVNVTGDTMSGNLRVPRIGIGVDASSNNGLNLEITETNTSGEKRGLSFVLSSNPASASSSNIYGFLGFADHISNQNKTGNLAGGYIGGRHSGTGSMSALWGAFGEAQAINTGSVAEAVGLYGFVSDYGGAAFTKAYGLRSLAAFFGTVDDYYGVYAGAAYQTYGSGAVVARNHGIYVEDQYIGTTNYGLYFAGSGLNNSVNWSGDTNLYRSGANILKTDDSLEIGSTLRFSSALDTTTVGTSAGRIPVVLNGVTKYLQVFNA